MSVSGLAMMGAGIAVGEGRAIEAARARPSPARCWKMCPLRGQGGAHQHYGQRRSALFEEFNDASAYINDALGEADTNIIIGCATDENAGDEIRITVIATGIEGNRRAEGRAGRAGQYGYRPAPAAPGSAAAAAFPFRAELQKQALAEEHAMPRMRMPRTVGNFSDEERIVPTFLRDRDQLSKQTTITPAAKSSSSRKRKSSCLRSSASRPTKPGGAVAFRCPALQRQIHPALSQRSSFPRRGPLVFLVFSALAGLGMGGNVLLQKSCLPFPNISHQFIWEWRRAGGKRHRFRSAQKRVALSGVQGVFIRNKIS